MKLWRYALMATVWAGTAMAQWSAVPEQAPLAASSNGELRERHDRADRLVNAIDATRMRVAEGLWRGSVDLPRLDAELASDLTDHLTRPPRYVPDAAGTRLSFGKLVPEVQAIFDWTNTLRRQVYDVLADPGLSAADRDARIVELLGYYRTRPTVALSARAKDVGRLNAEYAALGFRRGLPKTNGVSWGTQWLELALFEAAARGRTVQERASYLNAVDKRLQQMLVNAPSTTPYVMPVSAAVAPEFARRYPEVAGIIDNLHMLQDRIADVMVAREIPRSAKRREILLAAALFRSDTAAASRYEAWVNSGATIDVANMGGPAVGFGAELPRPTVALGMSLATSADSSRATGAMAGMDHGAMSMQGTVPDSSLRAIYDRMMSDPVIRERVATDPMLQQMLANTASGAGSSMPGMNMGSTAMPGMQHGGTSSTMPQMSGVRAPTTEEQRQANDFVIRLLADPGVEARIHSTPELHRLWTDPAVQQRLKELRAAAGTPPRPQP